MNQAHNPIIPNMAIVDALLIVTDCRELPLTASMDKKYLSVSEVATKLNLSERGVRERISKGSINAFKNGNKWQIPADQFRETTDNTTETQDIIEFLKRQLEEKDRQLAELTKSLQQQQTLLLIEQERRGFLGWLRSKLA